MARATVDRIIAWVTHWSGVQVLVQEDNSDSDKHEQSAFGRTPDKLHVSVRLRALTADGASVTSDRDDFGHHAAAARPQTPAIAFDCPRPREI